MNNEYIKALGQIPELVEATKLVLADNDKRFAFLAEAVQKRIKAEIPASEINKVSTAVSASVSNTRCIMPDVSAVSQEIAERSLAEMMSIIRRITIKTVQDAVKDTPITVKHIHTHTTLKEMTQLAQEKTQRWLFALLITCSILTASSVFFAHLYFNSEMYLGQQYAEICFSKYTTLDESKLLREGCYGISFLPQEYDKNLHLLKQRINRNRQILKAREVEAKANKGKFSKKNALER